MDATTIYQTDAQTDEWQNRDEYNLTPITTLLRNIALN
jgi:hypothetical protein